MIINLITFVVILINKIMQIRNTIITMTMSSLMLFSCNEVSKKADEKPKDDFKYMSEQFADIKIMRYQVPGFEQLSLQQKELMKWAVL